MKELSTEEKAKAYDEALKVAVAAHKDEDKHLKATLERIFPGLKESEDEKIRKGIKSILEHYKESGEVVCPYPFVSIDDALAWLAKQGEQKHIKSIVETWKDMRLEVYAQASGNRHEPNYSDDTTKMFSLNDIDEIIEKISEQKPTDKDESKFKNGQWIVWQDKCYKVNYNGCGYELVDKNGLSILLDYGTIDENAHLWDVAKDAKDGDVLVDKDDNIGIYKEIEGICWHSYIYLSFDNYLHGFNIGGSHVQNNTKPATKEQRDLLFQEIEEAGYEWDKDKKELKKIEQTPTWSEEDEKRLKRAIHIFEDNLENFENTGINDEIDESLISWLKSLKERVHTQTTWKPSEEQMKALEHFVRSIGESGYASPYENNTKLLYSLLNDLKKLKR